MPPARPNLSDAEVELLRIVARRPIPSPLRRSSERNSLRKRGMLDCICRDGREGGDTTWVVTPLGEAELARHAPPSSVTTS